MDSEKKDRLTAEAAQQELGVRNYRCAPARKIFHTIIKRLSKKVLTVERILNYNVFDS